MRRGRIFEFWDYSDADGHCRNLISEEQILYDNFWRYWGHVNRIIEERRKMGIELPPWTPGTCLDEFVVCYWATEIKLLEHKP